MRPKKLEKVGSIDSLEMQMAELLVSTLSVATKEPPCPATVADPPLHVGCNIPIGISHHEPAWPTRRKVQC